MNQNTKRYLLLPLLLVGISIAIFWVSGAWQLYKWVPPSESFTKVWILIRYGMTLNRPGYYAGFHNLLGAGDWRYLARIEHFVETHPDEPEYQFAWALINHGWSPGDNTTPDAFKYIKRAEKLDPENPIYPFWIGLLYSDALLNLRWQSKECQKALAAFDRAEKLDPDNAAIDIARLDAYLEQTGTLRMPSYFVRRGELWEDYEPLNLTKKFTLTPDGKTTIRKAFEKTQYNSYNAEAIAMMLKLLNDSGQDNLFTRTEIIRWATTVAFEPNITGLILYMTSIVPNKTQREVYAITDTLNMVLDLGLMIRQDRNDIMGNIFRSYMLAYHIAGMAGDLFLINDMPQLSRSMGQLTAHTQSWKGLWLFQNKWDQKFGFNTPQYTFMIVGSLCLWLAFVTMVLFVISFVFSLIFKSPKENINLNITRITALIYVLLIVVSLFIISVIDNRSDSIEQIVIENLSFLLIPTIGAVLLIYLLLKKKPKNIYQFIVPAFLMVVGLVLLLVKGRAPWHQFDTLLVLLLTVPVSIVLSAILVSKRYHLKWSTTFFITTKISAEMILILTLIILLSWAVSGRHLTEFMNLKDYNCLTPYTGQGGVLEDIPPHVPHYIPNSGDQPPAYKDHLETLEKIYGRDFSDQ